ncbi:MAG: prolyl oligopeptidase family serine peptidase [Acidobacteria bacterium]|nr:prolyl oligopeptidase family serine peptidase [Acidobacteriota bacterium]
MRLPLLLLVLPLALLGQEKWTPELSMEVRTIGEALPSADGRWLVYTVTEAVMDDQTSEMRTQLHLASTDGRRRIQLTRGQSSASEPQFSPNSDAVYFRAKRGEGTELWRIPVDGGEAQRVLPWKGSIAGFALSPDGRHIAFRGRKKDTDREKAVKQKADFRMVDHDDGNSTLWLAELRDGLAQGEPRALTDGSEDIVEAVWSPDSASIAVIAQESSLADDWRTAVLREITAADGAARTLGDGRIGATNPRYSPDGGKLAFLWSPQPARWGGVCTMSVLTREGGKIVDLPDTQPDECGRGTSLLGWSADGRRVLFTATSRVRNVVRSMSLDGSQETVYAPEGAISSYGGAARLDATGKRLGFALESLTEAPEAYWVELRAGAPKKLSAVNEKLPKPALGRSEAIRWKSPDGQEVEGLLTYPVGYQEGRRYPLILNVHGGPMGVFQETYVGARGLYPVAAFASEGFAVLRPNPRGSSGYGQKFRLANVDDWGGGDYEDVMAGVDHVIEMGVADPDRMAVMGWSYGGFMTAWVIGQTDRFRVAAAGAAVTNLWSFTGTADIPSFIPDYFSGEPWEQFEAYAKHSPMRYVDRVKTPTLVLHGESDERVPISQGYELYTALKRRGVETEMVVYPRQPHGPVEPKFVLDVMRRHLELARKHLRP